MDVEVTHDALNKNEIKLPKMDNQTGIEEETKDALKEIIVEMFHICDVENKGHVVKEDLYGLKDELDLDPADIDNAFEQLDTNRDTFLSMDEFTAGFSFFISVELQHIVTSGFASSTPNCDGIKIDFSFQVFNLIDKDDKGHITKEDLLESADTLEIDASQIDSIYQRLRGVASKKIYFEDFVNNISSIVELSPALREIKDAKEKFLKKKWIIER